jgi:hypothetical protein
MNFDIAVKALVDGGVEFIIIGGWSAILYGSSFMTGDLDIVYPRNAENLGRLVRALNPFIRGCETPEEH